MNIILDSNILFSALIKDSTTRKIILEYDSFFLFPSFIFLEMEKHKEELFRKSGMDKIDFDKLLYLILRKVTIIPSEVLFPYREEALKMVKEIDPNDIIFVACALAYFNSIIWSDDKKLKKLDKIKVLNTEEVINYLSQEV